MVGHEGLHHHAPRLAAAPGAARHLGEELEGALGGAEVGQVEAEVRVHDADQADAREVVALGDHLGADHDVDAPLAERAQHALGGAAAARDVAVEARDARLGKRARTSSSTRSVPTPSSALSSEPQPAQRSGGATWWSQ